MVAFAFCVDSSYCVAHGEGKAESLDAPGRGDGDEGFAAGGRRTECQGGGR